LGVMRRTVSLRRQQIANVVRLRAHDTSTEVGRSNERSRRIALSAAASLGARGLGMATSLITVPLTINYLGKERYGLWMAMSSSIALLSFADLGMANGLLTVISRCHGRDDRQGAAAYVSSAFAILLLISLLLAGIFAISYPWVNWQWVFNIRDATLVPEAGQAMACLIGCFLLNLPLGVVIQTQNAYQEGFASSLWGAVGAVACLVSILLVVALHGGLPWLVLAMAGVFPICSMANGIVLFWYRRPWLRPRWSAVQLDAAGNILGTGVLFFVLQVASVVAYQTDNMVLAQMRGLESVTIYSVPTRLFAISPMVVGFLLTPLWPAYGEALARGDVKWIKKTLTRSMMVGLAINTPAAVLLVIFGTPIIHLWTRTNLTPPWELMVGLGIWTAMNTLNVSFSMFLNGLHVIKFQAVCAAVMACANLGLSILLTYLIGVSGVIYGTVIAQAIFVLLPLAFYIRHVLSRMKSGASPAAFGFPVQLEGVPK